MKALLLLIICVVGIAPACRERRYVSPEDLILDQATLQATSNVWQTIHGFVSCPTCPRDASSMRVEVWAPELDLTGPLTLETYPIVGAYEASMYVPHDTLLEIRVKIFTVGGVRDIVHQVHAAANVTIKDAEMTVDLSTERQ